MEISDHIAKRTVAEGFDRLGVARDLYTVQTGVIDGDLIVRIRYHALMQSRPSQRLAPVTEHLLVEGGTSPPQRVVPWLQRLAAYSLGELRVEFRRRGFVWPEGFAVVDPPPTISREPVRAGEYA